MQACNVLLACYCTISGSEERRGGGGVGGQSISVTKSKQLRRARLSGHPWCTALSWDCAGTLAKLNDALEQHVDVMGAQEYGKKVGV